MSTVNRLEGNFGAEIRGIDVAGGADEPIMRLISQTLYEHRVVVIRDQSFDEESYLAFGRQWGTPIPHVLDHMRMPGYPELLTVGNTEERDRESKIRNGAALWHTDQSYEAVPASATMLYSILAPRSGGETQFCDMVAAYDALDEETRQRLDGLEMAHKYGRGRSRADEPPVNPIINEDQDGRVPPVYHPLVMPHPVTGVKALYALGHGAHGIRGMQDDEADALIESLKTHAGQERFIYRHKYVPGDLAIWDTFSTMHRATPIDFVSGTHDARLLWRISVRGKPLIYAGAA
ncbi:MAG: TauD/TfdA dioxygenase family protein [Gammaproteobacteria bacterium]